MTDVRPARLRALDAASPLATTPPALSAPAERLYAGMAPLAWLDPDNGWALAILTGGVGEMFAEVDGLVRDTAEGPGWSVVLDLGRCPAAWLPWLGQFVGVTVPDGASEDAAREYIDALPGFARGRRESIIAAAQMTLTDTETVIIQERYGGDAYALAVRTLVDETPDEAATLAAILAQKPAGLVLDYATTTLSTYDAVRVTYATYAALLSAVATYDALLHP